ncbi:MAG TPA: glycosyltransferase family 1 protein [Kiritimatiellia bacterium]|nr:glycosyltransferase family 1 protein [Kiritimatiellia bacterium]
MRVCIDIQSAIGNRAGVGRYTKMLVEHLAPQKGNNELALFHFDFQRRGAPFPIDDAEFRSFQWAPGRVMQAAWKYLNWPPYDWFAGPADVYHFPNFIRPPLPRGASVVTIHDVAFLRHPDTIENRNLAYLKKHIHQTLRRANAVITVSKFTAREVRDLLEVPEERLHAIPSGLDPAMHRPAPEAIRAFRARHELARPYLLSVGTLEPRKNFPFLIEVFERMTKFDGDLVIAGRRGWKYQPVLSRIERSTRRSRIRLLEDVPEADLPALYAGAELFALPSFYEGFGFPPLEAMACGTPAVVSPGGALEETVGDGALVITSIDASRWANEMTNLLQAPALRDALRQRGADQAARYTWRETARLTWTAYEAARADYARRSIDKIPGYEI